MKKILASLILAVISVPALAGPHHHRHHHYQHRHWHGPSIHHWVVPAIIGGAVVYAATRPDPVVIQPTVPPIQPTTQVVIIDGIQYQKQIMIVNGIQQEVLVRLQ